MVQKDEENKYNWQSCFLLKGSAMQIDLSVEASELQDQSKEFTPLTKQKLFDGVVLSKLTGTPISKIKKDSDGYWCQSTHNNTGQVLTYENSNNIWHMFTYDNTGIVVTFENSEGIFHQYITHDGFYGLRFEEGRYKAGCRDFSYEEAIEHWVRRSAIKSEEVRNRAKLFLKAIRQHHKSLKA